MDNTKVKGGIAIYATDRSAEKVNEYVLVLGSDDRSLYVQWPSGNRSWTPSYNVRGIA